MSKKTFSLLAALWLSLEPAFAAAPALTRIGAAGGVRGRVEATSIGEAVGHVIDSGRAIFLNDHVTTDAAGKLQVLLLDQTVFTLGANADMVLDEFVYDPATSAGKVTASITKGVFRFVTGKIAAERPSNMRVKLPNGTIGIRGTIVSGIVTPEFSAVTLAGPGSGNDANAKAGAFDFTSAGGASVLVNTPGDGTVVAGPNGAPTPPAPLPPAVMGRINSGLSAAPQPSAPNASKEAAAPLPPSFTSASSDGSATSASGEGAAAGNRSANQSAGSAGTTQTLGQTSTNGSQQAAETSLGVADGVSTWDQLINAFSAGNGFYFNGHTPVNCPNCTATQNSSFAQASLQVYFDFANKFIGGGNAFTGPSGLNGSFIHMHGVNTVFNDGSGDTIQQNISQINYASNTGNASVLLNSFLGPVSGGLGGENFNGTTLTLMNAGGIVAKNAVANMQFNTSYNKNATGTITSPRP